MVPRMLARARVPCLAIGAVSRRASFPRLICSGLFLAAMAGSVMGSAAQEGRAEPLGWQAMEHRVEERVVEGKRVQEHHATLVLRNAAREEITLTEYRASWSALTLQSNEVGSTMQRTMLSGHEFLHPADRAAAMSVTDGGVPVSVRTPLAHRGQGKPARRRDVADSLRGGIAVAARGTPLAGRGRPERGGAVLGSGERGSVRAAIEPHRGSRGSRGPARSARGRHRSPDHHAESGGGGAGSASTWTRRSGASPCSEWARIRASRRLSSRCAPSGWGLTRSTTSWSGSFRRR